MSRIIDSLLSSIQELDNDIVRRSDSIRQVLKGLKSTHHSFNLAITCDLIDDLKNEGFCEMGVDSLALTV